MAVEFTEEEFVRNHTIELEYVYNLNVPRYISKQEEEKKGYDIAFEEYIYPVYIQYKISTLLTRSNAKYWSEFKGPYYKFNLHRKNKYKQHNTLVELAKSAKTYYCAPAFFTRDALLLYHRNKKVVGNSVFVEIGQLGKITTSEQHCICFSPNLIKKTMHSEPVNIEFTLSKELFREFKPVKLSDFIKSAYKLLAEIEERFPYILDNPDSISLKEDKINANIERELYNDEQQDLSVDREIQSDVLMKQILLNKDEVYNEVLIDDKVAMIKAIDTHEKLEYIKKTESFIDNNLSSNNYISYLTDVADSLEIHGIKIMLKKHD